MQYFLGIVVFFFGAALGSFVLVVAERYNTGLSPFKGRSFCFACNTQLTRRDLFPIFSFLLLRGRCRYCSAKIPKMAFMVEIVMGALTVLAAIKSGFIFSNLSIIPNTYSIIHFLILISIFALILLISIYDLKHFIIPDVFLIFLFVFALLHNLFSFSPIILNTYPIIHFLISGLILTLPFLLVFLASRGRWLGFGDVKYIALIGFLLGLTNGLSAVILAFWLGAAFSLSVIGLKKIIPHFNLPGIRNNLTIKSEIPFGPFLSLGLIAALIYPMDLLHLNEIIKLF